MSAHVGAAPTLLVHDLDDSEAAYSGAQHLAEVLPRDRLVTRAWELAETIVKQPRLARRYARTLMIHELRRRMAEQLPLGLALQGFTYIKQL